MSYFSKVFASFGNFLLKLGAPLNASLERSGQDLLAEASQSKATTGCACNDKGRGVLGEFLLCANRKFSAAPVELCNTYNRFLSRDITVAEVGTFGKQILFTGVAFQIGKFTARGGALGSGPFGEDAEEVYTHREWKAWKDAYDKRHEQKK